MKITGLMVAAIAACASLPALADVSIQGNITEVLVPSSGDPTNDQRFIVFGNFTPAMGCATNGILLLTGDHNFAQVYAAMLAAQISGSPIKVSFSYCTPDGYGRVNGFSVLH